MLNHLVNRFRKSPRKAKNSKRNQAALRKSLFLESLEERRLLALAVVNDTNGSDLVNSLLGSGVSVSNVSLTAHSGSGTTKNSDSSSAGKFSGGTGIIGFESGIVLSNGGVQNVVGPNSVDNISRVNGLAGDTQLGTLAGVTTYDATILQFDFVPNFSTISFRYVFSSDEYNEYANGTYTDSFGFFVNGINRALVPGTSTPVSINTINGAIRLGPMPKTPSTIGTTIVPMAAAVSTWKWTA